MGTLHVLTNKETDLEPIDGETDILDSAESPALEKPASKARLHLARDDTIVSSPASGSSHHSKLHAAGHFIHEHIGLGHHDEVHLLASKEKSTMRPLAARHLFKRPIVKQYYADGKLKRTPAERESYRFELFFDLVYGGILAVIANQAVQNLENGGGGSTAGAFVLTYYPAYVIWADQRMFLNQNGVDDVIQRLYLFFNMAVLIGYTANATSISEVISFGYTDTSKGPFVVAIAFLLVCALVRDIRTIIYALWLPRFRLYYLINWVISLFGSAFYVPLAFVSSITWFAILLPMAFAVQMTAYILLSFAIFRATKSKLNEKHWIPAMAYEHYIDRTQDFTVLVIGVAVLSACYKGAGDGQSGVKSEYGRAILTLLIAFCLAWLYFAQASARRYVHAVRRHWLSALVWHMQHFSFTAALTLGGAACGELVQHMNLDETSLITLRWYLSGSLCVACVNLGSMGHSHRSLDVPNSPWIRREYRLWARYGIGIVNLLMPLVHSLQDTVRTLAVHAVLMSGLLLIEIVGKMGTYAYDDHQTDGEGAHILGPSLGLI